jgi:mRNA interferase HigB
MNVRIVSKAALTEFAKADPAALEPLMRWYRVVKAANWNSLADVKLHYLHADYVAPFTVFHVGGNKYRIVAVIKYQWRMVYVRHVLTHGQYDEGKWKL